MFAGGSSVFQSLYYFGISGPTWLIYVLLFPAIFYITLPFEVNLISPIIKTEVEWRHIFFNLGMRISPYLDFGGVKPYLGLGYKF